jgi:hypothetical protein
MLVDACKGVRRIAVNEERGCSVSLGSGYSCLGIPDKPLRSYC